jgi:hypothetical protein
MSDSKPLNDDQGPWQRVRHADSARWMTQSFFGVMTTSSGSTHDLSSAP